MDIGYIIRKQYHKPHNFHAFKFLFYRFKNFKLIYGFVLDNQILFTSDIKGYVKAWTMKELIFSKESADSKFSELFCFRAHHGTIVSIHSKAGF